MRWEVATSLLQVPWNGERGRQLLDDIYLRRRSLINELLLRCEEKYKHLDARPNTTSLPPKILYCQTGRRMVDQYVNHAHEKEDIQVELLKANNTPFMKKISHSVN